MPGTMSGFLLLHSDLGLLFVPFFSPFLITSPRLSGFVDGPRVRLELDREQTSVLEGYRYAHKYVPTHGYHPLPVHCSLILPLKNSVCFVILVCECICTKAI